MESAQAALTERLNAKFPQCVMATHHYRGDETVSITGEGLVTVCRFLRDDPETAMNFLMDLTCVDYLTFDTAPASDPTL